MAETMVNAQNIARITSRRSLEKEQAKSNEEKTNERISERI